MSHLRKYIIVLAEDDDNAKTEVSTWLDDYANREFFDYGRLDEPEQVSLLKDIAYELERYRTNIFQRKLPAIMMEIEQSKAIGDRSAEGCHHIRYGRILCEQCCDEMPFFNITNNDWSIPNAVPEDSAGKYWHAVMVDLHY